MHGPIHIKFASVVLTEENILMVNSEELSANTDICRYIRIVV